MKRLTLKLFMLCTLAAPLFAQPEIGGGACTSGSLSGAYAISVTGRQVTAAGTFTNAFQAIGSATFDGLNKVSLALTADTPKAVSSTLTWSGTYSIQANCAGAITITAGANAVFNLVVYNNGLNFLITGSDAAYYYSGSGSSDVCSSDLALLSGSYVLNGTGYGLSGTNVSGVTDADGVLQFDGKGKVTANVNLYAGGNAASAITSTGSYSVASSCLGSASLTDSKGNSYSMSLSINSGNATADTDLLATFAQAQKFMIDGAAHTVTADTCNASFLSGTYPLTLGGRAISSAGSFSGSFQGNGIATFDGLGKVTLSGTTNTNLATGKAFNYSGNYSIPATCSGIVTITTPNAGTFGLTVWNLGKNFNIVGMDATYVYSGSGSVTRPNLCGTATLSGEYVYDASGFILSGGAQSGVGDESGFFQFDGQGNMTAIYLITPRTPGTFTATGTYTVGANCLGSASLMDSSGKTNSLTFSILNLYGQAFDLIEANTQFVRSGAGHVPFANPTQSIGNVASYVVNYTPPGSVFVLFGDGLAAKAISATNTPLPTTLGTTSVTVNGEPAPLFYVDPGQIDAQMPWDIPGGTLATVIVKNGSTASNATAVYVPATGTPGISFYSTNRAVVANQDNSINSPTAAAAVGDQVVAYFTGGGPVNAAGKLTSGAPAPNGLSPVTGDATVTVGGQQAVIKYIGLTPGAIGLYQVNFIVPALPKGTYPVIITIAGTASNNPVMTISN